MPVLILCMRLMHLWFLKVQEIKALALLPCLAFPAASFPANFPVAMQKAARECGTWQAADLKCPWKGKIVAAMPELSVPPDLFQYSCGFPWNLQTIYCSLRQWGTDLSGEVPWTWTVLKNHSIFHRCNGAEFKWCESISRSWNILISEVFNALCKEDTFQFPCYFNVTIWFTVNSWEWRNKGVRMEGLDWSLGKL